ncbi:MAG: SusC/RagA family TonB-linked outer membrane protein [Chitinophagaceae bacterium]
MTKQLHLPRLGRLFLTTIFLTCLVGFAVAQRTVSGKVTDAETRAPLGGVSVIVKGTTNGTATDAEGNFKIDLKAGESVLSFSFNGYVSRDVAATANMTVALEVDVRALQSVVVTGYTSQRKKDITGAVAVVDAKQLAATPAASVTQMLQGKASGVIVGNDNSPGGGTMVRIRGFGTINNNSPLYVIDGVPTQGTLNQINPYDIESMQVLKDASAASIYGARAANGVVIITTKKGKSGDPKINFDYYTGTQVPGKMLDLLNAEEYGKWLFKSEVGAGRTPWVTSPSAQYRFDQSGNVTMADYINPAVFGTTLPSTISYTNDISDPAFLKTKYNIMMSNKAGTDWQDVIFDPASISNYQVGASGGTKNAKYSFSANAFNQDGILRYTNYRRYSVRANTEFTYGKLTVGENVTFSYDKRNGINNNTENQLLLAVRIQPIIPVFDITGGPKALGGTNTSLWDGFGGPRGPNLGNATNPLAEMYRAKDNYTYGTHMFGNTFAEYAILKNLKARSSMGIEYNNFNNSSYFMRQVEAAEPRNTNSLTVTNSFDNSWTWYNTLNYNTTIKDDHDINVLAGTEAVATYAFGFNASRSNFSFNEIDYRYLNAGSAAGLANSGSGAVRTRLFSQFAKVNYGYKNLLLADFTIRRDGSSRFSSAYRYGVFPAGSLGLRLTELKPLSNLSWLDDLKVRAGWGKTGNQLIPNVYNSYTLYSADPANNGYDITGTGSSIAGGFDLTQFGNPNGRWETTTSANVGFDASLFNSKLDVVFDWYTRTTSDMLAQIAIPRAQGQGTIPYTNIGTMRNRGVDLNIDWKDKAFGGNVRYSVGLNLTHYKNEVIKLNNDPNATLFGFTTRIPSITATKKGYPIASFYGFFVDGILDAQKAATAPKYGNYTKEGSFFFRDTNGDGVVTAADRTILGNPHPDFIYGLNLTAGYKNWDLAIFAKGTYGNEIFNYVKYWTDFNTFQGNRSKRMLYDSYGETDKPLLPKINASDGISGAVVSTYFLEDGSYLRLSNVQLTYSIPDNIMKKIGLTGAQLYVQGQNILTVTKYSGYDPDINIRTSQNDNQDFHMGIDEGAYPAAKQYLFGVRVKF